MKALKGVSVFILILSFLGCSKSNFNGIQVKNWKMKMNQNEYKINFTDFYGNTEQQLPLKNQNKITIVIQSKIEKGKAYFYLMDQKENQICKIALSSIESIKKTISIDPKKVYRIKLSGENASGNFSSTWN
ncbi:hypothetical protein SAMN04489761_0952 [Tenacibaculum sp. MAR_2009_124]|uniref:hypothetical protein n=1 Tax=Tenacibaculum sp. MAR_2009_124 TaxID=1250059 RepID=UPI00089AB4BD|nr:hypothetical protein [Tenacibaculum sp. MAR_2009_124]SEB47883.1 hypothetical protein SAMN04489761_0952 [Tenacibaculum sp. MAR_2009_124]